MTYTFHFPKFGQMTMTTKDFSAITSMRVGGREITLDNKIYKDKETNILEC